MSKQTTKPKVPADPIESARAMLDRFGSAATNGSPRAQAEFAMLQTALIVRAIDRLTAAVKMNTKAIAWSSESLSVDDVRRLTE